MAILKGKFEKLSVPTQWKQLSSVATIVGTCETLFLLWAERTLFLIPGNQQRINTFNPARICVPPYARSGGAQINQWRLGHPIHAHNDRTQFKKRRPRADGTTKLHAKAPAAHNERTELQKVVIVLLPCAATTGIPLPTHARGEPKCCSTRGI